jgi:integrin alpha FG-GAP repeat containing protein 1
VHNNYFHDSFFLKALTLNGACQGFCEPKDAPKFQPWGTNYGGASYKFTVLDPNGVRRAQQVGQLPQTAYRSLLMPYSYFGLGRTNNYVESLFIGSTRRQKEHFLAVEGVIPNSQVVINPWQGGRGSENERGGPGTWTKQLYLHPGDWIPWVTVVLITTIVGLAVIVVVLHINERREDERERKRAVNAINFDAL